MLERKVAHAVRAGLHRKATCSRKKFEKSSGWSPVNRRPHPYPPSQSRFRSVYCCSRGGTPPHLDSLGQVTAASVFSVRESYVLFVLCAAAAEGEYPPCLHLNSQPKIFELLIFWTFKVFETLNVRFFKGGVIKICSKLRTSKKYVYIYIYIFAEASVSDFWNI